MKPTQALLAGYPALIAAAATCWALLGLPRVSIGLIVLTAILAFGHVLWTALADR